VVGSHPVFAGCRDDPVADRAESKPEEQTMERQQAAPTATSAAQSSPVVSGVLQRKCGCGRHTHGGGSCSSCSRKRRLSLHRAAVQAGPAPAVPPVVHEVLAGAGQPLDPAARSFMEPRFGQDFSGVRVHTDARAAESAHAVGALAYTVGRHVVFGAGQYAPGSSAGRLLLAHELAHVVQQGQGAGTPGRVSTPGDPLERAADALADAVVRGRAVRPARAAGGASALFRKVAHRMTNCTDGTDGAPTDAFKELTDRDSRALDMSQTMARELENESDQLLTGKGRPKGTKLDTAYEKWFGLPPKQGDKWLNRLKGGTHATRDEALGQEMKFFAARYRLLARMFGQWIHYRCIGGAANFAGCAPPHCNKVFAWSCAGIGAIFLCPDFWTSTSLDSTKSKDQQASTLVHEGGHINWTPVTDTDPKGSGRNFHVADCYSTLTADTVGFPPLVNTCNEIKEASAH
jgi:hypothetical protein